MPLAGPHRHDVCDTSGFADDTGAVANDERDRLGPVSRHSPSTLRVLWCVPEKLKQGAECGLRVAHRQLLLLGLVVDRHGKRLRRSCAEAVGTQWVFPRSRPVAGGGDPAGGRGVNGGVAASAVPGLESPVRGVMVTLVIPGTCQNNAGIISISPDGRSGDIR